MIPYKIDKRVIENIFSLSALNILNMALPLLTLPYLIRTVGIDKYGAYSIVFSMVQYILLISAYGFEFSTTKTISQNREANEIVSRIFCSTISTRFVLAVIPFCVFALVTSFVFSFTYLVMLFMGIGMIVGEILNPTWLFQGMEKMRYMTFVNFVSKITFTLLIFVFVKELDDYIYIILIHSVGYLVAGVLSFFIATKEFRIKLNLPSLREIHLCLSDGFYVFLSTIFMNLYRNSNTLFLGFFLNETLVGVYAGAEKIIKASQAVLSPVAKAVYPRMSAAFKLNSVNENINKVFKITRVMTLPLIILSVVVFISAPLLDKILLAGDLSSVPLVRVMACVVFLGGQNQILGVVGLVNLGYQKHFTAFVAVSGVVAMLFLLCTVQFLNNISAAIAMSLSESLLFVMCMLKLISIKKNGSNNNNKLEWI